jgi:Putative MetA-pathway of phenol degradation
MRRLRWIVWMLIPVVCAMHRALAATDDHPGDYVPLPAGISALLSYNLYGIDDGGNIGGKNFSGANTGLRFFTEVVRYVHYFKILDHTVDANLLVPFGGYWDGQIGGVKLNNTFGAADPFLASSIWLIERPDIGRYFSVTPLFYIPVGSYTAGEPLNTGENRWKGTLEFGWVEPLLPAQLTLELNGNVTWFGQNDRAGLGNQTLTQQPSLQFQPWLRYNFTPFQSASFGFYGQFGGGQRIDGFSNGFRTSEQALRLNYQQLLTENLQLSTSVLHDVAVSGGFRQVFVLDVRLGLAF